MPPHLRAERLSYVNKMTDKTFLPVHEELRKSISRILQHCEHYEDCREISSTWLSDLRAVCDAARRWCNLYSALQVLNKGYRIIYLVEQGEITVSKACELLIECSWGKAPDDARLRKLLHTPLSQKEQEARKPPPPDELVDALQNRVHKDIGRGRAAKIKKR